jgi:hypothetical protein
MLIFQLSEKLSCHKLKESEFLKLTCYFLKFFANASKMRIPFLNATINFLKFLTIYNSGQSNLKLVIFVRNAILKVIVTSYTKRVIVSHMSGIMNL